MRLPVDVSPKGLSLQVLIRLQSALREALWKSQNVKKGISSQKEVTGSSTHFLRVQRARECHLQQRQRSLLIDLIQDNMKVCHWNVWMLVSLNTEHAPKGPTGMWVFSTSSELKRGWGCWRGRLQVAFSVWGVGVVGFVCFGHLLSFSWSLCF